MPRKDPTLADLPSDSADFPRRCHRFFRQLADHNDREWFAAHRATYHDAVLEPARAFVVAAGRELSRFAPTVTADPRANGQGSISRIQRDTRFAADKTPYRTFVGILFWQGGEERKWDSPAFHLVFQPGRIELTAGIRRFAPAQLATWREACGDADLRRLLGRLQRAGFALGGSHYKRLPAGHEPKSDLHGALLRHRGLTVAQTDRIKVGCHGAGFLRHCVASWRRMAPLNRWLEQLS